MRTAIALALTCSAATPSVGAAPKPAAAAEQSAEEPKLAKAKELFSAGNDLRRTGDLQRALELYVRSYELVPSVPNTWNIATCLAQLGRADEALVYYEQLLTTFRAELSEQDHSSIVAEMARQRDRVGSIDMRANVDGTVTIDGRPRGTLPLLTPIRAMPGKRTVIITKDRYAPFEAVVDVTVGKTVDLVATLVPLSAAGRLRIDQPALVGADVIVDGAPIGRVPWEGALAPGSHVLSLQRGDQGSGPKLVTVIEGQIVVGEAELQPLGPQVRLVTTPASAQLLIDGVAVGTGRWQGRLPLGSHTLEAREDGYFASKKAIEVDQTARDDIELRLEVDAEHPRWADGAAGSVWLDLVGGLVVAPSLGSGAESSCGSGGMECTSDPTALGFLAGARIGYEFSFGLSLEALAAFAYVRKDLERTYSEPHGTAGETKSYSLQDSLRIMGPAVAAGVGYRQPLGDVLHLRAHVLVGALFGFAEAPTTGTATLGGQTADVLVMGGDQTLAATDLLLLPELTLGARYGAFHVDLGLLVGILTLGAGSYDRGEVVLADNTPAAPPDCNATPVQCISGSGRVASESAWGTSVLLIPSLTLGAAF